MKFAYADPPYLGWSARYYADHPEAADYDDPETHRALVNRLCSEFDGWAMSLHSPALRIILPMCPEDVRVMAWCKPFASFKPGVHPAYAWEPVIIRGPRTRTRTETTIADYHLAKITLQRGLTGAKPESFVWWVLAALNVKADDEFVDLFPGSGAVGRAWDSWRNQLPLALTETPTAPAEGHVHQWEPDTTLDGWRCEDDACDCSYCRHGIRDGLGHDDAPAEGLR